MTIALLCDVMKILLCEKTELLWPCYMTSCSVKLFFWGGGHITEVTSYQRLFTIRELDDRFGTLLLIAQQSIISFVLLFQNNSDVIFRRKCLQSVLATLPPHASVLIKITYVAELQVDGDQIVFNVPCSVAPWRKDAALAEITQVGMESFREGKHAQILCCLSICLEVSLPLCFYLLSTLLIHSLMLFTSAQSALMSTFLKQISYLQKLNKMTFSFKWYIYIVDLSITVCIPVEAITEIWVKCQTFL